MRPRWRTEATPIERRFEDFGSALLRGDRGTGYARVDWYTPAGLGVWGDGRLTVLGTEGTLEVRKYVDPAGRPGGDHLLLVDSNGDTPHRLQSGLGSTFAPNLLTEVARGAPDGPAQARAFLAQHLALEAQAQAAPAPLGSRHGELGLHRHDSPRHLSGDRRPGRCEARGHRHAAPHHHGPKER